VENEKVDILVQKKFSMADRLNPESQTF
jgi:hypothetical protein